MPSHTQVGRLKCVLQRAHGRPDSWALLMVCASMHYALISAYISKCFCLKASYRHLLHASAPLPKVVAPNCGWAGQVLALQIVQSLKQNLLVPSLRCICHAAVVTGPPELVLHEAEGCCSNRSPDELPDWLVKSWAGLKIMT